MQLKTYVEDNKHIGLLFQPRSGSHVVRHYLSTVTNKFNLGELFNPKSDSGNRRIVTSLENEEEYLHVERDPKYIINSENRIADVKDNINILHAAESKNRLGVCGITVGNYIDILPEVSVMLKSTKMQFIRLERADVLSSILSIHIAVISGQYHKTEDNTPNLLKLESDSQFKLKFDLDSFRDNLVHYATCYKAIPNYFGDVPTIYYEQFQNNIHNLRNMFEGIPKQIVSNPYSKLGKNYKEFIVNIDDVEDVYEQFVNENKECFPQYFGKLPHIKIPKSQGRQPRDLSLLSA